MKKFLTIIAGLLTGAITIGLFFAPNLVEALTVRSPLN